jgi:hypothetical protein
LFLEAISQVGTEGDAQLEKALDRIEAPPERERPSALGLEKDARQ